MSLCLHTCFVMFYCRIIAICTRAGYFPIFTFPRLNLKIFWHGTCTIWQLFQFYLHLRNTICIHVCTKLPTFRNWVCTTHALLQWNLSLYLKQIKTLTIIFIRSRRTKRKVKAYYNSASVAWYNDALLLALMDYSAK